MCNILQKKGKMILKTVWKSSGLPFPSHAQGRLSFLVTEERDLTELYRCSYSEPKGLDHSSKRY